MNKKTTGIYTTKGDKEQLVAHRALINGVQSIAIMKGNELISYLSLNEFWEQANAGAFLNLSTSGKPLGSPIYCVSQPANQTTCNVRSAM